MLYECEKHCNDYEWEDNCIGDRIIGEWILLQLSCQQSCLYYSARLGRHSILTKIPLRSVQYENFFSTNLNPLVIQTFFLNMIIYTPFKSYSSPPQLQWANCPVRTYLNSYCTIFWQKTHEADQDQLKYSSRAFHSLPHAVDSECDH